MVTASTAKGPGSKPANDSKVTQEDLEADIALLRADLAKLTEQLSITGEHSYKAARRAANQGAEHMRAKGEEAVESLRSNATDVERQISETVREKPIASLAVAAGVGFLFALLTSR